MAKIGTAYQTDNFGGTPEDLQNLQTTPFTFTTGAKQSALLQFSRTSTVTFFDSAGTPVGVLTPTDRAVVFPASAVSYVST